METQRLRILLVEDDRDDYVEVRTLLARIPSGKFALEWIADYNAALEAVLQCRHDVILLDYRLGAGNGLELLREAVAKGCRTPMIVLTGHEDYSVDVDAMNAGAADYLIKDRIDAPLLERAIRYAVQAARARDTHLEHLARVRKLLAVSTEMLAETTVDGLLRRVVRSAVEITGAQSGFSGCGLRRGKFRYMAVSAPDGTRTRPGSPVGFPGPFMRRVCLELMGDKESIRLSRLDLQDHPVSRLVPESHVGLGGLLCARLSGGISGHASGLILVSGKEADGFTMEDEVLLTELAAIASLGLQHVLSMRRAERRAQEAERAKRILEALMEHVPKGMAIVGAANSGVYAVSKYGREITRGMVDLYVWGREGKAGFQCLRPDGAASIAEEDLPLTRAIARGEVVTDEELVLTTPSGRNLPILCNAGPIRNRDGGITGGIIAWCDMTALKESQKALKESEEKYRTIFEMSPVGIFHFDRNGTITAFNDALTKSLHTPAEELIGFNALEWKGNEHMGHGIQECLRGNVTHFEGGYHCNAAGGKSRTVLVKVRYNPIVGEGGKILGGIGTVEDVTEQTRTQNALRESERRLRVLSSKLLVAQEEERKRIAREIHDSIGSSLTAIKYGVECAFSRLDKDMEQSSDLPACRETFSTACDRIVSMVQGTVEECRRLITDLRPSILDDLGVLATINWFCRQFESIYADIGMEVVVDVDEAVIPDRARIVIYRIMQEAFNNIAKYSRTDRVLISLRKIGNSVKLEITDYGVGFDVAALTSRRGESGGLGLTSMQERTEFSGGTFAVISNKGKGTTITASWPCNRRRKPGVGARKPRAGE